MANQISSSWYHQPSQLLNNHCGVPLVHFGWLFAVEGRLDGPDPFGVIVEPDVGVFIASEQNAGVEVVGVGEGEADPGWAYVWLLLVIFLKNKHWYYSILHND